MSWQRPVSSVTGPASAATNTAWCPGTYASTWKGPMTSRAVNPGYSTKAIVTGFGCWPSLVAAVAPCASVLDILIPSLVASGPGRSQAAAALLQGAFLGWRALGDGSRHP